MLWPFSIFLLRQKSTRVQKLFLISISFFILYFLVFLQILEMLFGLAISVPFLFGLKTFFILFFSIILFLSLYNFLISYFPINQNKLISFLPVALIEKITNFNFNNIMNLLDSKYGIRQ